MIRTIILRKAEWSPSHSQALMGFDERGEYTETTTLFSTEKRDVFRTLAGGEVIVQTWATDPRNYKDKK